MSYLDAYISLPAGAPGKLELQGFFEERYEGEIGAFNQIWGQSLNSFDQLQEITEFNRLVLFGMFLLETKKQKEDRIAFRDRVATRYYSVVHNSIRAVDPAMLILGTRFVSIFTAPDVIAVAGPYVDVVSVNSYQFVKEAAPVMGLFFGREGFLFSENPWKDLGQVYQLTGKPVMITEYSYRAVVPEGPPSNHPPGYPTFATQQERADYYSHYMNELYDLPYVVGAHWFEHCDQPATGRRGDGENNNFGVVNVEDEVYPELTNAMRAMNNAVRVREGL
jgi:agarase